MTQPSQIEVVCASCSHLASGKFCSNCGASLEPGTCSGCGSVLSPGARYCHSCGKAVSIVSGSEKVTVTAAPSSSLPWVVAAIALITLLAFLAGSAFNKRRGSSLDAPQNALPQAGLDDRGVPGAASPESVVRGPDISQLSPQERANRLFNRVMILAGQGKTDSVLFFAPMAIEAYRMLSPLNADQRYDLGRIAETAGAVPLAKAQADTILLQNPTHLLGLILGARVAALEKRTADGKALEARLVDSYTSETAKKLPEYERHQADITAALSKARQ
jgi:hypothetical protein